ncbi:MAG: metallophosphoesterase [Bacteroidales bacterium]|nr:metallophosphoesterase [Bacteroidales bacterium]
MKINKIILLILVLLLPGILLVSCKKEKQEYKPTNLEVSFPQLKLKHDLYYSLSSFDRFIEIEFSESLDSASVPGNIHFSDKSGSLDGFVETQVFNKQVLLLFDPEFALKPGWQYFLTITSGVVSTSGKNFPSDEKLEFRTMSVHPGLVMSDSPLDSNGRNSIVVISDIHMGDARATALKYGWFGENSTALYDLLDFVNTGNQVKQVVIMGDMFDEWIVPFTMNPFDPQAGINNQREYYLAVANNPVNSQIVGKLKDIAANPGIDLIYIHGNHDMLFTNEVLQEIIPGTIWKSDTMGLGKYLPVPEIVMEHGHRYDFFNCPQSLVNAGHMLPPGYFISRYYAQGTMENPGMLKSGEAISESFEFDAAWDVVFLKLDITFRMVHNPFEKDILMGGIDNYTDTFSYHGIREMYSANIEAFWETTQATNQVAVPGPCCIHAIWNSNTDFFDQGRNQYLEQPPAPVTYKIVAFGHTHEPMLEVYPAGSAYTGIYANSGSWVDSSQSSKPVRSYLVITPAAWSGSGIDVVTLYQYNLEGGNGGDYEPKWMAEESI